MQIGPESLITLVRATFRPLARSLAPRVSANALSLARPLFAVPLIWCLASSGSSGITLAVYIVGWILDILDGIVADERRRLGKGDNPRIGELIDAICDKLYLTPILVSLLFLGPYAASASAPGHWLARVLAILVLSELSLLAIHLVTYYKSQHGYESVFVGKVKVWAQALGTGCLIVSFPQINHWLVNLSLLLLSLALFLSLRSVLLKLRRVVKAGSGKDAGSLSR